MKTDRSFPLLLVCFFLSGTAALVYETAWTREFAFVFGTSELAIATVLAAYMGGLAAGAAIAGRLARRIVRPVWVYGLLELGIALAALAVPFAITLARGLYVWIFGGHGNLADSAGGTSTALFYLAASFVILFFPTAMMGATLPLLARHAVREDSQIGSRIGLLYGINTAGAVVGTISAAFVLLPALGLRATIAVAAGINALVFVAAWVLARHGGKIAPERSIRRRATRGSWILPMMLLSGALSFGYEVLWVRLLTHLVGGSVHAFASMLGSFLSGIAIGAALASRFASSPRRATLGFGLAQLGIALLSLAAFAWVERIPGLTVALEQRGIATVFVHTIAAMATLFPAALCIGATFPFAVRVLARDEGDAGPASARVYSWNTLGSIVGSILSAFWLLPLLGFEGSLALFVGLNLLLAACAALAFETRRFWLFALAAVAAGALVFLPPARPWALLYSTPMSNITWGKARFFAVGRSSTVLLSDQLRSFHLRTNGLPEAGITRQGTWPNRHPLARWLTNLPVLARPEARTMLVVGLGGGMAVEAVADTIEQIDVVELEPEVVEANRVIAAERWRDPLADPRVRVHINDARNALLLADRSFDAIVSQPSHPWAGGAAHLYTQEFFLLARERLAPDGVFVQWIGLPFVDEELFRGLLAALDASFPHVRVYAPPPGGGVLFIASRTPFDFDATTARALASAPEFFAIIGLHDPAQVSAALVLDEQGVRSLARGAEPNRDGHNRLQARSADLGDESLARRLLDVTGSADPLVGNLDGDSRLFPILRFVEAARAEKIAEALDDPIERKTALAIAGMKADKREGPRKLLEEVLAAEPRHEEARAALMRLSVARLVRQGPEAGSPVPLPLTDVESVVVEAWRAREGNAGAVALRELDPALAAIPESHPLYREAVRLRVQWRLASPRPGDGRDDEREEALDLAYDALGQSPDPASILLIAQAEDASGNPVAVLELLRLLGERLEDGRRTGAYVNEARRLLRGLPDDPATRELRSAVSRFFGL